MATQNSIDTNKPIEASKGGTGVITLAADGLIVGDGASPVVSLVAATDGQIPIGNTGNPPTIGSITSTNGTVTVTGGAGTLDISAGPALLTPSGFESWGGAGNYFDDTTLGEFEILRAGTGYIKGVPIAWAGAQTVTGMTAGNTYLIYIDDTGTIGKTTTYGQATFENYIVLFECLRDSTAGTNNQVTVKENHPYDFQVAVSYWGHETVGVVIENHAGGANITLNGTVKIQINGDDELSDHGLYTDIPDSGGVAEVFNQYFTLGSGKWARYLQSDTFNGQWNSAGTATALGNNKFSVSQLYVSKDNITVATPVYISILGDAQYNNIGAAQTAVANGSIPSASGELAFLEISRLGYIIFSESAGEIVDVIIDKQTISSGSTTSGTNVASLVTTSITNFDGILSAADTNVQAALDTIDDWGKTATDHGVLIGQGVNTPVVAQVLTDGQLIVGSTGVDPVAASLTGGTNIGVIGAAGSITVNLDAAIAGTTSHDFATGGRIGTALVAGNTLTVDAYDVDGTAYVSFITLTANNTPTMDLDDAVTKSGQYIYRAAGTDVPVTDGGTGVSTLTDHGLILGSGAGAVTSLAEASDGQIPIGSTGNDCVLATITGGNNIGITNAAGSITVDVNATTQYALQVGDATASLDSLATGTATQILQSGGAGAIPAWSTATFPATTTQGDILYSSADNVISKLAKDATATRYLSNTGATNNPSWDQVELTNGVSGILPVANGGLGVADPTDHALVVGSGAGAMTVLAAATDGQIPIGSTGADPVVAALTAGSGINITNAAGSITVSSTDAGVEWTIVTADTDPMVVNSGYICNKAGLLALTLPTTAAVGTVLRATGMNTDLGWTIAQSANQIIHFGDVSTTTGVGGSVSSVLKRDSVELVCVVADLEFNIVGSVGNLTIV